DVLGRRQGRWLRTARFERQRKAGAARRAGAALPGAGRRRSALLRLRRGELDLHARLPARSVVEAADRDRGAGAHLSEWISGRVRRLPISNAERRAARRVATGGRSGNDRPPSLRAAPAASAQGLRRATPAVNDLRRREWE